ncbi:phosphoprotein phosphatase 2A 65K regulatory chain-like with HEAT repeats [Cryptosporidium felis]|nr:phosphoprotein phosphatase 2A 65K regulatory chain-like with HEAT repeats [Cryptosporidium felis]
MEEVIGSLWCLDNVPGSSLFLGKSGSNFTARKPFYSSERCSDLTMEYEMMLLEVRPNSSPTNISATVPVITSDTTSLEFGPSNDLLPEGPALFSCRLGIHRRPSETAESDSSLSSTTGSAGLGPSSGCSPCHSPKEGASDSLAVLHRPGIPRDYARFICPSGAEQSFAVSTESTTSSQVNIIPKKKTHKSRSHRFKDKSTVFDHKLHEATRNFFMVDIARAATDDLF